MEKDDINGILRGEMNRAIGDISGAIASQLRLIPVYEHEYGFIPEHSSELDKALEHYRTLKGIASKIMNITPYDIKVEEMLEEFCEAYA